MIDKELKNDLIMGLLIALLFVGAYFLWDNSPTMKQERYRQRQHAIEFLRLHQWDMLPSDVQVVMDKYNILLEEITPLKLDAETN